MNTPEILSPAGDFENLKINFAYGADAVYLSGQNYRSEERRVGEECV